MIFFFFNDTATTEIYTFPYTTLFRSPRLRARLPASAARSTGGPTCRSRSEEHTAELQSPCNLVCPLLLEKKKKDAYQLDFAISTTTLSCDLSGFYLSSITRL